MNMHMKPEMPMRNQFNVLAFNAQFNMVEVLRNEIKSEIQVDMTLETLFEMFSQFRVSYNMNKLNMSLIELMKELQNVENVPKTRSRDALVITFIGPSSSKLKGKRGNKRKGVQQKGPTTKGKEDQNRWFHC